MNKLQAKILQEVYNTKLEIRLATRCDIIEWERSAVVQLNYDTVACDPYTLVIGTQTIQLQMHCMIVEVLVELLLHD